MPLSVHVKSDETGTYVGVVEDLPGCVTQGSSFEELLDNLRDAIKGDIDARRSLGWAAPSARTMRLTLDVEW
jgi:predicted RNase H-like HicB family nuclease